MLELLLIIAMTALLVVLGGITEFGAMMSDSPDSDDVRGAHRFSIGCLIAIVVLWAVYWAWG